MGTVAILTDWCVKGTVSRELRWVNPKENPAPFLLPGTKSPYPYLLVILFCLYSLPYSCKKDAVCTRALTHISFYTI